MSKIKFLTFSILCLFITSIQAFSYNTVEDYVKYLEENRNENDLLNAFLKYGDSKERPILTRAMDANDCFSIVVLIENGADVNARGTINTDLDENGTRWSTYGEGRSVIEKFINNPKVSLEYLLFRGADPTLMRKYYTIKNNTNPPGEKKHYYNSAVYHAIFHNNIIALHLLARYGVDFRKVCNGNQTPIQVAAELERKEVIQFLISIGATFNY